MPTLLDASSLTIRTVNGRVLFDLLDLRLEREHVALVGRNGVGKSTLLAVLAGEVEPSSGRVWARSKPYFVAQAVERSRSLSLGELRHGALSDARNAGAEILLLDEPSEHLDDAAVAWLRGWLSRWPGCLLVASHDRRLLADFRHFFVVSESGCRYFSGDLAALDAELEREQDETERRYLRNLERLAAQEQHTQQVARRKARKKRSGRCRELDRATPRMRLNQKRDHAQVSHGRLAVLREARLASLRAWTHATRRALPISLSLELPAPSLPVATAYSVLALQGVSVSTEDRVLFQSLDLNLGRERIALVGPNGSGKSTLIDVMLGRKSPHTGSASRELTKIGWIGQAGSNWLLPESLLEHLSRFGIHGGSAARLLLDHKFPLALGERPLASLSAGERTRAALLCLFSRAPALELLILDEPTYSLDLLGQRALSKALKAWPGALVVASHDRAFLSELGLERTIVLGA